jgi:Zn-dependent protease with chaperone function
MHISLILFAIGFACGARLLVSLPGVASVLHQPISQRWARALLSFLLPPLLLLTTSAAVLGMGTQGEMFGLPVGWFGYWLALLFVSASLLQLLWLTGLGWRSSWQMRQYPQCQLNGLPGRIIDHALPFAAQVGVWRSQLIVSQGLLDCLSAEQLQAVLAHEEAHAHHRDTFWFFGLGWLRQITGWLPHTEALWQELLLLRELRADRWASQRVDSLLLAEALLLVVQSPLATSQAFSAAFGADPALDRLEERIDALLSDADDMADDVNYPSYVWLSVPIALLPLVTMLFHT